MQNNPKIFKSVDIQYKFNAIIISYWDNTPWGNKLLKNLVNNSNYKLVYVDPYTLILVRDTNKNKQVIARNVINEKNRKFADAENIELLIHYLFFFEKVGWKQNEKAILSRIQLLDPQLCTLTHYPLEKTFLQEYLQEHRCNNTKLSI